MFSLGRKSSSASSSPRPSSAKSRAAAVAANAAAAGKPLTGDDKLKDVTRLMDSLKIDADKANLSASDRLDSLQKVRTYGREVPGSDPIFTKDGIDTLCKYAFQGRSEECGQEARRTLANAFLLQPQTRQMFVDLKFAPKAVERYKTENSDDECAIARMLFLMTYDTDLDFAQLMTENQLDEAINTHLERHAKNFNKSKKHLPPNNEVMGLTETLKLLFNLSHFYSEIAESCSRSIPQILKILSRYGVPKPALQSPVNYLIQALLNLDLQGTKGGTLAQNPVFPKFNQNHNAEHLVELLHQSIDDYREDELDGLAYPVLELIRRIYGFAPEGVKRYMQWLLLPTDSERNKPLGQSDTLASRLLRVSSSTAAPNMSKSISEMFFELSDKDANKFVQNIGYGFAAGFLVSNNIEMPENASEAFVTGTSKEGAAINPITGQKLDAELEPEGPPMTEEEKEREAERLFVLFERLKKTGVVDIKNPVQEAVDSGRFEEIE